jgi:hypothetical protein
MAGLLNAAMKGAFNAVTTLADTVSSPKDKEKKVENTYDNASEDILHKINQDMESALQSKVGKKGGHITGQRSAVENKGCNRAAGL